jgi:WD40 repeat protein
MALDISPRGSYLCTIDRKGAVRIFNYLKGDHGTELAVWQMKDRHGQPLNGKVVAYDPQGCYLAAGSTTGQIMVFHLMNLEPVASTRAHKGFITSLVFPPDGHTLYSAGEKGMVRSSPCPGRNLSPSLPPGLKATRSLSPKIRK